jgi:hypothetical protein
MTCIDSGNKPDQTGCNDGDNCSYGDVCKNGACLGTKYSCFTGQCQSSSTCDGAGGCTTTNLPNGTTCGYPDDCSCCSCGSSGTCQSGICHAKTCCSTQACCCLSTALASGMDDELAMIICPL